MKELKDTVDLMLSEDFKDRLVAEWLQLTLRIEKLDAYLDAKFPEIGGSKEHIVMHDQLRGMVIYQNALEARACELGIDLESYK